MLNSLTDTVYPNFKQTQQVVIQDILTSDDLDQHSYIYDDCFLVRMRARFEIDYSSPANQRQENVNSESSSMCLKYAHLEKNMIR
jgi:hypothetical protein